MKAKDFREFEVRLRGFLQQTQKTADSLESEVRNPSRPDSLSMRQCIWGIWERGNLSKS